jgi:hypothetical protein
MSITKHNIKDIVSQALYKRHCNQVLQPSITTKHYIKDIVTKYYNQALYKRQCNQVLQPSII